jgi:eukaryotic-like serine/threonine-protein kinase
MGEVWVADQQEPVQRLVALKVIRPGLDSGRLLARFEAERQALAMMDHPGIAKILDAGVVGGRPYFVMDVIHGVPITRYCDEAGLSPHDRLGLFVSVCQAVQHAHQKGVIHRDIKPSNILVASYDGKPVPKVIDFGVAKATGPRLAGHRSEKNLANKHAGPATRRRPSEAIDLLVSLYNAWGRSADVAKWRKELEPLKNPPMKSTNP